ncbi:MAG: hypothetical protein CSB46_02405 [Micrococcales bacterium]|nr:MAG: hypothetical protein CSB46_02405 [Micrococcales bacterium]
MPAPLSEDGEPPAALDTPPTAADVQVSADTGGASVESRAHPVLPARHDLRVLAWNVRDLLGEHRLVYRAIAGARADVLCLQEGPRLLFSRYLLDHLGAETGMYVLAGGRDSAGVAILVSLRAEVHDFDALPLTKAPRSWRLKATSLLPRPRGLVRAEIGLPGRLPVRIASIHLPVLAQERAKHVPFLRDWPDGRAAQVLAGDLNEEPGGPSWRELTRDTRDPGAGSYPTFPAARPHRRIDAVHCVRGSDHLPVCADVRLPVNPQSVH